MTAISKHLSLGNCQSICTVLIGVNSIMEILRVGRLVYVVCGRMCCLILRLHLWWTWHCFGPHDRVQLWPRVCTSLNALVTLCIYITCLAVITLINIRTLMELHVPLVRVDALMVFVVRIFAVTIRRLKPPKQSINWQRLLVRVSQYHRRSLHLYLLLKYLCRCQFHQRLSNPSHWKLR